MNRIALFSASLVLILGLLGAAVWVMLAGTTKKQPIPQGAAASELRKMKDEFVQNIQALGPEAAYAQFVEHAPAQTLDPHDQAHAFGEALYETNGLNGLKYCDASFEFGCYHSFFGVAVHNEGIGTLTKFDEACKDKYGTQNLPCQHGIGHGILVYTDYDKLEDALELCETISDRPTGGCSSGVFMEYNFHTMDDVRNYIREAGEDMYAPCNTLPARFQMSCYFEQVQWWQNIYHNNFKKIGELCAPLAKNRGNYEACYNGTGNYVAAAAELDTDRIIELCSEMPTEEATGLCHEGASWRVWPEDEGEKRAHALCEALPEPYSSQCLRKLIF